MSQRFWQSPDFMILWCSNPPVRTTKQRRPQINMMKGERPYSQSNTQQLHWEPIQTNGLVWIVSMNPEDTLFLKVKPILKVILLMYLSKLIERNQLKGSPDYFSVDEESNHSEEHYFAAIQKINSTCVCNFPPVTVSIFQTRVLKCPPPAPRSQNFVKSFPKHSLVWRTVNYWLEVRVHIQGIEIIIFLKVSLLILKRTSELA